MIHCENDARLFDLDDPDVKSFFTKLRVFQRMYNPIHGYLCVGLCVFGILTNLLHVVVLSRPNMRMSAVNCLLTAVALCDLGTMSSCLVYILHFVILRRGACSPTYTYGWMQFLLWHVVLSITLHSTSLWIATAMAFFRRMSTRVSAVKNWWQNPTLAWRTVLFIYGAVFVLSSTNLFMHDISPYQNATWSPPAECKNWPENYTEPVYTFSIAKSALANNCRIFKANLWLIGTIFKLVPCVLVSIFSVELMLKLKECSKRHRKFTTSSTTSNVARRQAQNDRTTLMLICILIVFILTEVPQGIISILCAIFTADVHNYLYFYLGDVLDLLSLINSSVNFVLYCIMSSRYRQTFWTVVCPWKKLPQRANSATYNMVSTCQIPNGKESKRPSKRRKQVQNHDYTLLPTIEHHYDSPLCENTDSSSSIEHL